MKNILLFLLVVSAANVIRAQSDEGSVCVYIDVGETKPDRYPNIAVEVEDFQQSFRVSDGELSCFDLAKQYYMQFFMLETDRYTLYGTTCKYEPHAEDEGKTLVFEGENGGSLCPIVDRLPE